MCRIELQYRDIMAKQEASNAELLSAGHLRGEEGDVGAHQNTDARHVVTWLERQNDMF
jgi:hypothetical protein